MAVKVHLFIPCYIDQFQPEVAVSSARILREFGCELVYPDEQTCCGQPMFNTGYTKEARRLAERFLNIFERAEYIVAPSGSCVAMVQKMYGQLQLSGVHRANWESLRERIYEFSQFLEVILGQQSWEGVFSGRVTYHDSCHLLRELGVAAGPRRLLRSIEGLEYVEMPNADTCCGFGGLFSAKYPEISTAMLENKVSWIQQSGAEWVVASDVGCLMNIDGYLKKHHIPVKTIHLVQLLWLARQKVRTRQP